MSVFRELKRRNVFRVAAAYLVAGWLLIEVSATLEETLHLPAWADSLLAYFLILGFPIALFFSWAFEITPEGVKRERDIAPGDTSRVQAARRLDWAVIVLVAVAGAFFVLDRFLLEPRKAQPQANPPALTQNAVTTEADAAAPAGTPGSAAPALSIAVLPFVNLSSDREQEYFSDGLTEELLNLLAGIDALRVTARTSSFYYKDKLGQVPLAEIARELNVAHVLEGSVRKGGNQIRITAQLIKVDGEFHLWSRTWDRTLTDVFAIQDEIAAAVADELKVTLLGEAPRTAVIDTRSFELTLQARYLYTRRAEGDLQQALSLFERAVALDPANAEAWIGLVPLYMRLFEPPRLAEAVAAADHAVRLDPENPEVWSRRAQLRYDSGDSEGWSEDWERAVELGDNSQLIQAQIAGYWAMTGDLPAAIATQQRAVALDPLHLVNLGNLASFLLLDHRPDEARVHVDKMLSLAPDLPFGLDLMATIHLLQGRPAEARELADRLPFGDSVAMDTSYPKAWYDALIEHALGNREAADAALAQFIAEAGEERPVSVACLYAWRGDNDAAFEWLNRALDRNPELSVQYSWEVWLHPLRDDPRWASLMQRWTGSDYVEKI